MIIIFGVTGYKCVTGIIISADDDHATYGTNQRHTPGNPPPAALHKYPNKIGVEIWVNVMEMPGMFNPVDRNGSIS